MSDTYRLADQLHRAFAGAAWHGDSLLEMKRNFDGYIEQIGKF